MPFTCLLHLCYIRDNIHVCEEISTFAKSSHTWRKLPKRRWWCTKNKKKTFPNIFIFYLYFLFLLLLLLLLLLFQPNFERKSVLKLLYVENVKISTTINLTRIFNCIFISRSFSFSFSFQNVYNVRWSLKGSSRSKQIRFHCCSTNWVETLLWA